MSDGTQVRLGADNAGDPIVVLVHGSGMDHTVWRFQSRWLANRGYRVMAPDLPGHGSSPGPVRTTIAEWAEWLSSFLAAQEVTQATVVGHSMGSLIAVETAVARPDLIHRLVLVGVGSRLHVHPALMSAAREDEDLASQLMAGWSFSASFAGGHPEPGTWEQGGFARLVLRAEPGVLAADLAACESYPCDERAAKLTVETLLVSGSDDRMTPAKGAKELAGLIPGAQMLVLPGAGHEPMVQVPRRFNALLAEFLTSHGKSTAR
ncbi:MAG: alpha/beta fold hydrolase [Acidimicrobiia bacterium]